MVAFYAAMTLYPSTLKFITDTHRRESYGEVGWPSISVGYDRHYVGLFIRSYSFFTPEVYFAFVF